MPSTPTRSTDAGMRAWSSGVSGGSSSSGFERRVADGLRAEWIEVRGEMAVGADRLDQRHRRSDASDQQVVSGAVPAAPAEAP